MLLRGSERRAGPPICTAITASLKTALAELGGRHYRVEEITCEAMGAPNCKFAVYKPA